MGVGALHVARSLGKTAAWAPHARASTKCNPNEVMKTMERRSRMAVRGRWMAAMLASALIDLVCLCSGHAAATLCSTITLWRWKQTNQWKRETEKVVWINQSTRMVLCHCGDCVVHFCRSFPLWMDASKCGSMFACNNSFRIHWRSCWSPNDCLDGRCQRALLPFDESSEMNPTLGFWTSREYVQSNLEMTTIYQCRFPLAVDSKASNIHQVQGDRLGEMDLKILNTPHYI